MTLTARQRWLAWYVAILFAWLPVAPAIWRRWLQPLLGPYVSLDAIHVGEYVVLGWLLRWSCGAWSTRHPGRALWLLGGMALLDEAVQGLLPNRFADLRDMICDWIGGAAGWSALWLLQRNQTTANPSPPREAHK